MKIAVIGAGWIGIPLVEILVKTHAVCATTRSPEKVTALLELGCEPILFPNPSYANALPREDFDAVVVTLPPSAYLNEDGVPYTELAEWINAHAKHVIFLSSTSVYPTDPLVFSEDDAQRIVSPHSGVSILDVEEWNAKHWDLPSTTLRLGGLVGYDRLPWKRNPSKWLGDGSWINYTHRNDAVSAIITVIKAPQSGVFNVVCPLPSSKSQVWSTLNKKEAAPLNEAGRRIDSSLFQDRFGFTFEFESVLKMPEVKG